MALDLRAQRGLRKEPLPRDAGVTSHRKPHIGRQHRWHNDIDDTVLGTEENEAVVVGDAVDVIRDQGPALAPPELALAGRMPSARSTSA